jgi:hypothetical protein
MKAIILKKMMPAAVFVLGISGALLTTSMQSDAKIDDVNPIMGFVNLSEQQPCAIQVPCDDQGNVLCRAYPGGPQAFGISSTNPTTCSRVLFRPQ